MPQLNVNGERRDLSEPCPLVQALPLLGFEGSHFAVALDGDFVPRHRYPEIVIKGGESLEVLAPMQGG